ncbi:MAG: DUF996 domain-containing protein [Candidatus Bathyarchaeia archaeon]|jgi:uncharacterized membrane protein
MTFETNKTMGGIGALLMVISPIASYGAGMFSGLLGLVGLILVLIAMKGLADHYNEAGIFNNTLYGVVLTIVGAIVFAGTVIIAMAGFLSDLNIDWATFSTDPSAISNMDWGQFANFDVIMSHIATVLIGLLVLFVFVSSLFYKKSLDSLAKKTNVGLFGTTGLILLIGAVLTIIAVGFILIWVAGILLTIAFFSIKSETTPPPAPTTM